ncbi:RidA family protein [Peterkaempfera bronchialis]|uniref:RidA family protein n=1 Tax=Peterkaempfera bronchialis TaxID=2126346 RepID=A0A345STJ7_9ACTN|nr:RidA family protein [Peterkaempfera bronchialis]AXI77052.1 RidA family protein [Peterkaempfera bronchialis]
MTDPAARRVAGFSPYEDEIGFSRAVAAGDFVLVSGCTAWYNGMVQHEGDPHGQALDAFAVALEALEKFGLGVQDVVRTRMYVTHVRDTEEVGRAHKELFGTVRPAATMVVVDGLIDSRMMVEVEVDAHQSGLAARLAASQEGTTP